MKKLTDAEIKHLTTLSLAGPRGLSYMEGDPVPQYIMRSSLVLCERGRVCLSAKGERALDMGWK